MFLPSNSFIQRHESGVVLWFVVSRGAMRTTTTDYLRWISYFVLSNRYTIVLTPHHCTGAGIVVQLGATLNTPKHLPTFSRPKTTTCGHAHDEDDVWVITWFGSNFECPPGDDTRVWRRWLMERWHLAQWLISILNQQRTALSSEWKGNPNKSSKNTNWREIIVIRPVGAQDQVARDYYYDDDNV